MKQMMRLFAFDKELFRSTSSLGTVTLFSLMLPILCESVMNQLIGTVNTAVLSGYSDEAVAAVGSANRVVNVLDLFLMVISTGATILISKYIGANNEKKVQETAFSSITFSIAISGLLAPILLIFSQHLMLFMNLKGTILTQALIYFRIRVAFLFLTSVKSVLLALLRCFGFPKYTFLVGIITNVINLLLNVYVVYLPQYSPFEGVTGISFASITSSMVGLIVTIFVFSQKKIRIKIPSTIRDTFQYFMGILRIGLPSALSAASFNISSMLTTAFIAQSGDYALSASVYFSSILSYVYLFSICAGQANALLIGRFFGAGEYSKADRACRQLVKLTCPVNFLISVIVLLFRHQLLSIFTDDPHIHAIVFGVFAVDIITELARSISHVYENALRATEDVYFTLIVLVISCVVFGIGLSYVLVIPTGLGLLGYYLALMVDETVRGITTFFRWEWKKKKWMNAIDRVQS